MSQVNINQLDTQQLRTNKVYKPVRRRNNPVCNSTVRRRRWVPNNHWMQQQNTPRYAHYVTSHWAHTSQTLSIISVQHKHSSFARDKQIRLLIYNVNHKTKLSANNNTFDLVCNKLKFTYIKSKMFSTDHLYTYNIQCSLQFLYLISSTLILVTPS